MADKTDRPDLVAEAYRRHSGQIFRYLLRRTGSVEEAEDLTQRVFADAAAALDTKQPDSVLAWLYAVAERRFIDEARRRRREGRRVDPAPDREATGVGLVYQRETARALREEIRDLPSDQRTVVVMKLLQGRSFAEIARAVGASEDACKMRFSRALRRLRDRLGERGVGP